MTRLHPRSRRALRRQDDLRRARDLIRSQIVHRACGPDQLPSEADLMASLGCPRAVVRGALALLREEGHVDRVQGIGTFPTSRVALTDIPTFHGVGEQRGIWETEAMTTMLLDWRRVPAPAAVSALLKQPIAECLRAEFVVYVDEEPLALATDYVRDSEAARLEAAENRHGNWYRLLREAGIRRGISSSVFGATVADEYSAALLKTHTGAALLTVEQVLTTETNEPFNVAFASIRPDRMAIIANVPWC